MHRQSQNLHQICEEKKEYLAQLRQNKRNKLLNAKRESQNLKEMNELLNKYQWLNIHQLKEYINNDAMFKNIIFEYIHSYSKQLDYNFGVHLIIYYYSWCDYYYINLTSNQNIASKLSSFIDYNLKPYIILSYNFKYVIIRDKDTLNECLEDIEKIFQYKYDYYNTYIKINCNDIKHYDENNKILTMFIDNYIYDNLQIPYVRDKLFEKLDNYLNYMKPILYIGDIFDITKYYIDYLTNEQLMQLIELNKDKLKIITYGFNRYIVKDKEQLNNLLYYFKNYCENNEDAWILGWLRNGCSI